MYPVTLMLPPGVSTSFTVTAPANKQHDPHSGPDHSPQVWAGFRVGVLVHRDLHQLSFIGLGLLLGTEAPVMTPSGVGFSFLFFLDRLSQLINWFDSAG